MFRGTIRISRLRLALVSALTIAASPDGIAAQEVAIGPATWSVVLRHVDLHPRSPRAARSTLDRLEDASMRACGASSTSLREAQIAVRASACWRTAMVDVLARIDDPALNAVFRSGSGRRR